ncbi:MAG: sigma-54-dependent Fis family transcriptional regulator [Desulfuromonadales bacterium]|nr:sigma-54-dependent Fis family transcriptional regulator [Desulfuromonadales bacterium]
MMSDNYSRYTVLIVDDEPSWLRAMDLALERTLGTKNLLCSDSSEAMALLARQPVSLILLDVTMPHISGDELLETIKAVHPHLPVIITTGLVQVELAVECMKRGAFDYFVKTTETDRIMNGVRRAFEMTDLRLENRRLREHFLQEELEHPEDFTGLITTSPKMRAVCQYIEAIAQSPEPVLILGESGVGKELVARAVHTAGRSGGPWVAVNIAGLDDNVFSDTLFGHIKGAYTGADKSRSGVIEEAAGGTLFLDEIGDLSPVSQVKLLRLLQEGDYYPLGSDTPKQHRTRFVFATNRDLAALQASGGFRPDLYYRLNAYRIALPPLRERPEDIPLLLDQFLDEAATSLQKQKPTVAAELVSLLQRYPFPGNIREMRAMIFEALSLHKGGPLKIAAVQASPGRGLDLPLSASTPAADAADLPSTIQYPAALPTLKESADLLVDEALRRTNHNQTQAARLLGISRPALSKRLKIRS